MDLDYSSESDLNEVIAFVYQLLLHLLPMHVACVE